MAKRMKRLVVAGSIPGDEIELYSYHDGDCDIETKVDTGYGSEVVLILLDKDNQRNLGKALLYHAEHGSLEGLE